MHMNCNLLNFQVLVISCYSFNIRKQVITPGCFFFQKLDRAELPTYTSTLV